MARASGAGGGQNSLSGTGTIAEDVVEGGARSAGAGTDERVLSEKEQQQPVEEDDDDTAAIDEAIDEPALERGDSSLPPSHAAYPSTPPSLVLFQISTYSLLVFITIWGVLARLGLEWIGTFAEGQVFNLIWAQIAGCFVMGFVVDRKKGLERVYPPLFVALGTGFCGSLTTFSSWMFDVFAAFAQLGAPSPNRFSGFLSGVAITMVTFALSIAFLSLGQQLSSLLPKSPPTITRVAKHPKRHPTTYHLISFLLGPTAYAAALLLLILGPSSWRPKATFAIVFGPPGTILRYELSRRFNRLYPSLPIGTLTANILAVLIFSILAILQRRGGMSMGCDVLQGMEDGFCGSLSTVSTFVVELRGLKGRDKWRYAMVSWVGAQVMLVLVLGSWEWSGMRREGCK